MRYSFPAQRCLVKIVLKMKTLKTLSLLILTYFIADDIMPKLEKKQIKEKATTVFLSKLNKDSFLDPSFYRFSTEYVYLDNLSIRLIQLDKNGNYTRYLASSIHESDDKLKYSFSIKEAYFSDGTKITLEHVLKSLKRVVLFNSPHTKPKDFIKGADKLKSLSDNIEGLRVIDDKIYIELKYPVKELFYFLQLADYAILHPKQYNKEKLSIMDWHELSSGPYYIKREKQELIFVKNKYFFKGNANNKAPQKIILSGVDEKDSFELMSNNKVDFGRIHFSDYMKYHEQYKSLKDYELLGGQYSSIVHIDINIKSAKFKSNYTRQWLNKKIQEKFNIRNDQSAYMAKAYQYFLPGAKGFLDKSFLNTILENIDTKKIPNELKDGITITTLSSMEKLLPKNFEKQLSEALEIPIKIDFSISNKNYLKTLTDREYDAFIIMTSMSYKVLAETLNLSYKSNPPAYLDPTGKIHKLLAMYQKEFDIKKETSIIKSILKQMVEDSECIPLFYAIYPKFYNTKTLNIDELNLSESMQFWKLKEI